MNHISNNRNVIHSHLEHHAQNFVEITCTSCNSTDIIETHEGHTCRNCGMVLDQKKLAYHRPYDENTLQHAKMGTTQIGLYRERMCHPHSKQLQYLNKLHLIKSNENAVIVEATIEMSQLQSLIIISLGREIQARLKHLGRDMEKKYFK